MPSSIEKAMQALAALQSTITAQPADDPYYTALQEFSGIPRTSLTTTEAMHETDPEKFREDEYVASPTGKLLYRNGVIADPATGEVVPPPGQMVPGSPAWTLKVQEQWSTKEANTWRKRLSNQGYEVARTGGMAHDLLTALMTYHSNRYLNFGKPLKLQPKTRQQVEGAFDWKAETEEIGTWGEPIFGEDLLPGEKQYFASRLKDKLAELIRKHPDWSIETAKAGAEMRVQEEFLSDPEVKQEMDDLEALEGDTTLRQNIVSISQLARS